MKNCPPGVREKSPVNFFKLMCSIIYWFLTENDTGTWFLLWPIVDRMMKACKNAFDASVDNAITWFDPAEFYGSRVRINCIMILIFLIYFHEKLYVTKTSNFYVFQFSFGAKNYEALLGR